MAAIKYFVAPNPSRKNPIVTLLRRGGGDGFDLESDVDAVIEPGQKMLIPTGLKVEIPYGYYGRIAPRSGLAFKKDIWVNAGVIDSSYRGIVGVVLKNLGNEPFKINERDRIAQLLIEKVHIGEAVEVKTEDELSTTSRGADGFGSTGVATNVSPETYIIPAAQSTSNLFIGYKAGAAQPTSGIIIGATASAPVEEKKEAPVAPLTNEEKKAVHRKKLIEDVIRQLHSDPDYYLTRDSSHLENFNFNMKRFTPGNDVIDTTEEEEKRFREFIEAKKQEEEEMYKIRAEKRKAVVEKLTGILTSAADGYCLIDKKEIEDFFDVMRENKPKHIDEGAKLGQAFNLF